MGAFDVVETGTFIGVARDFSGGKAKIAGSIVICPSRRARSESKAEVRKISFGKDIFAQTVIVRINLIIIVIVSGKPPLVVKAELQGFTVQLYVETIDKMGNTCNRR